MRSFTSYISSLEVAGEGNSGGPSAKSQSEFNSGDCSERKFSLALEAIEFIGYCT